MLNKMKDEELLEGARNGNLEKVKKALEKGADIEAVDWQDQSLNSLQLSARQGHVNVVEFLLEKGMNINKEGCGYGTPLQLAARWGHTEVIKFLIKKGADIERGLEKDEIEAFNRDEKYFEKRFKLEMLRQSYMTFPRFEEMVKLEILRHGYKDSSQGNRKEAVKLLRKGREKGLITKEEALKLFGRLLEVGNKKAGGLQRIKMRLPRNESNGERMRKSIR
ncbi:ankyrin repeat domain-containing protein [Candidatus Micrarchaeota archaeon]|nr:ankyrin repeat domain-containing protein [Candidatus Micrarchaeota archaeon]